MQSATKVKAMKTTKKKIKKKEPFNITPYIFIVPFFITFLTFSAFPIFYSLYLSFFSWNGIKEMQYVGFRNYSFIILKDSYFWRSLLNTIVICVLSGVPQHVVALSFAFILNEGLVKLKNFFKGVFFLPYITSTAAITIILSFFLGAQYGLINQFLRYLNNIGFLQIFMNIQIPFEFYQGPILWFSLAFIIFWKWVGWNVIIYLAGLQTIPRSLYESAQIDGASWFQIFYQITLPLLKPIIFFATSLTIIYGLQIFDEPVIWITIPGLFSNDSFYGFTTAVYMYAYAFTWGKFGVATASSYLLCIIILFVSTIYRRVMDDKS